MGEVAVWMGRAGSGKSKKIAMEIRSELSKQPFGPKVFWVVPSDASYATEQLLMREVPASIRCEVITLQRLAERANQAMNVTQGATAVNTTGKRLALADVYQDTFSELQVLRREYPSIAFLDAILEVFDEMSAHLVSLHHVESALEVASARVSSTVDPLVAMSGHSLLGKLRDLCLLYVHWNRALQAKNLFNPAELVDRVGARSHDWSELQGALIFVDGFEDLSPRDLKFLVNISAEADKTVFGLSADRAWLSDTEPHLSDGRQDIPELSTLIQLLSQLSAPGDVYAPQTLELYRRIGQAYSDRAQKVELEEVSPPCDSPMKKPLSLVGLERHLFRELDIHGIEGEGISWAAAQNIQTETDGVAQEIFQRVHRDRYQYGDIVVLVPNVTDYAAHLRDSFAKRGIPFYMDDFPSFATHPLAKFILAALQVVEDGFSTDSIVRLFKSDFCGLDRDDADWLETYIRQHEIVGMTVWAQADNWRHAHDVRAAGDRATRLEQDDRRADELRRTVASYLLPLAQALEENHCYPQKFATALWTLMEHVQAKRIVAQWMVNDGAEQSPHEASLHEQAWQRMMGLLSDLTEVTDSEVSRSFLIQVVKSDIIHQSLSTIPAGVNQVLVTESSRARAFTSKVVFVMGVVDGVFPRKILNHGLLQDEERLEFRRLFGQDIGYSAEDRQVCERSTVYHALTRATERLYVTYPLSNSEGKEIRPATWVGKVKSLFNPETVQEWLWTGASDAEAVNMLTAQTALALLVRAIRQGQDGDCVPETLPQIYQWFCSDEQRRGAMTHALKGLSHETIAQAVSPELARSLYGNPMKVNVYQLETFASCPYQHFAKYGLRLHEEITPDVTAATRGTLLHDVLMGFVQAHMQDVATWRVMSDEDAILSMQRVYQACMEQPQAANWLRKNTRRQQAEEVYSVLEHAAVILTRHARYGRFAPVAMELSFGDGSPGSLPSYDIPVSEDFTVSLRGRVDRVDFATDGEASVFRIIDYKSSELDIDLNQVHHGLRLQLPIYAAVIAEHSTQLFGETATPAAMIYIPVLRRATPRLVPLETSAAREESLKKLRARGYMVHHPKVISWMDERLTSGEDSELFKKVYKKDGDLMKNAPTLSQREWDLLISRAARHVHEIAKRIQSGDISVSPYQLGPQDYACQFCPYSAVCHIDKRWDGRPVRYLEKFSRSTLQDLWAKQAGQEGQL